MKRLTYRRLIQIRSRKIPIFFFKEMRTWKFRTLGSNVRSCLKPKGLQSSMFRVIFHSKSFECSKELLFSLTYMPRLPRWWRASPIMKYGVIVESSKMLWRCCMYSYYSKIVIIVYFLQVKYRVGMGGIGVGWGRGCLFQGLNVDSSNDLELSPLLICI